MKNLAKRDIVKIIEVTDNFISWKKGLSMHKHYFPNCKVGDKWRIFICTTAQFPLGELCFLNSFPPKKITEGVKS